MLIVMVMQEQHSSNINGDFLIIASQVGKSSQSLKQSEKDHYGAMPTLKMSNWKWYDTVQMNVCMYVCMYV
jgi:hypothetical protein